MATDPPPRLPAPDEPPLLAAPPEPLRLAPPQPKPTLLQGSPRVVLAASLALLLLLAFLLGWFIHHRRAEAAEEATKRAESQTPLVIAIQAKPSAPLGQMLLPGSLSPIEDASVYARASGYVSKRHVDIGDTVRKNQILADIDSPELDQQVLQAVATTAQARRQRDAAIANVANQQAVLYAARVTLERYQVLLAQDSIARQQVDTQQQVTDSAEATLRADKENVDAATEGVRAAEADQRRLAALQGYEHVRAPFDGVVTARNIDEGALIGGTGAGLVGGTTSSTSSGMSTGGTSGSTGSGTSGSSGSSGSSSSSSSDSSGSGVEMFHVAQIDRLRVYVDVPQESALLVTPGTPADVLVQESGEPVAGAVTRTARALDSTSRTLLAEVQIPNAAKQLLPGMFAQVRFTDPRPNAPLMVSGEALITRAAGTQVAVLEPLDDAARRKVADSADARCARRIRLQPVSLGRDYGTAVEITSGLRAGDFVVLNPGDMVRQDAVVLPRLQPPQGDAQAGAGSGKKQGGKDDGKGGDDKGHKGDKGDKDSKDDQAGGADDERRQAQETCLDQQASVQARAEAASAPAHGASTVSADAPSDRTPAGIRSPGMAAPTQGSGGKKK